MSLQHHDNGERGEFFLLDEQGKKIAKLTLLDNQAHHMN